MIVLNMLITQSHSKRLCRRVVFRAHALVNISNVALPAFNFKYILKIAVKGARWDNLR